MFSENLKQNDVILTFNYDTVLESSLSEINKNWNHGFDLEDSTDPSIPILKLHGSIDWWKKFRRCEFDNATKLYEITDLNRQGSINRENKNVGNYIADEPEYDEILYRVSGLDEAKRCFREFIDGTCKSDFVSPGIAGLGGYKPLSKLIGSGDVWRNANNALKAAEEIYIIGWSASIFDTMARFYFCSMLNQREKVPGRIVVVDPNVGDGNQYTPVFGNVTPVAEKLEDVNWDELLVNN